MRLGAVNAFGWIPPSVEHGARRQILMLQSLSSTMAPSLIAIFFLSLVISYKAPDKQYSSVLLQQ